MLALCLSPCPESLFLAVCLLFVSCSEHPFAGTGVMRRKQYTKEFCA